MRTRKRKKWKGAMVWISVLVMVILAAVSMDALGESENTPVKISGGREGKEWEFLNPRNLQLKSGHMTIGGEASADLKIECDGASQLTIDNLKANGYQVVILALQDCVIHVIGHNELDWVSGWETMEIQGESQNAALFLKERVDGKDLRVHDLRLHAALVEAERDMDLTGTLKLVAEKPTRGSDAATDVRIKAGRNIDIKLAPGGSVTVEAEDGLLPFLAEKKMTLGKDNTLLKPEKGTIKGQDTPYGPDCHFVLDQDGDWWVSHVVIKNLLEEQPV